MDEDVDRSLTHAEAKDIVRKVRGEIIGRLLEEGINMGGDDNGDIWLTLYFYNKTQEIQDNVQLRIPGD